MWAARRGMLSMARLLVDKGGADVNVSSPSGLTPLMIACGRDYDEVAAFLLEKGAKPGVICVKGRTALIYASEHGHKRCVHRLLETGVENVRIDCADQSGKTAFAYACLEGHAEVAWLLVLKGGANYSLLANEQAVEVWARGNVDCLEVVKVVDAELPSLKQAVQRGDVEGLCALLPHALPVLTQAVDGNESGNLLMFAIKQKQTEVALRLINEGTPVDWRSRGGNMALHEASIAGDVAVASALLEKGAAIGEEGEEGKTPLCLGCEQGHACIVDLLLTNKRFTPIMWRKDRDKAIRGAEHRYNQTVLQSMLRHGVGILEHQGAFWTSSTGRALEIVIYANAYLQEHDWPLACYSRELESEKKALHEACHSGNVRELEVRLETYSYLLYTRLGDEGYRTPLMTAAYANQVDVARVLLEYDRKAVQRVAERGAALEGKEKEEEEAYNSQAHGINAVDKGGATALRLASERGHVGMVNLLLDFGARVGANDRMPGAALRESSDALTGACVAGHEEVVGLLLARDEEMVQDQLRLDRLSLLITRACEAGQDGVVMMLVRTGLSAYGWKRRPLWQALVEAARTERTDLLRLLLPLTAQLDVNKVVERLSLALWQTVMRGNEEAAKLLLDHGADTWLTCCGEDALPMRRMLDNMEPTLPHHLVFKDLLRVTEERRTVLVLAAMRGQLSAVEEALGEGSDGSHVWVLRGRGRSHRSRGDTALTAAAVEGHTAVVERLLALGAEVDLANRWGFTPLKCAGQYRWPDVVRVLCAAGASLHDSLDEENQAPDFVGTYDPMWDVSCDVGSLEVMLEAGADFKGGRAAAGLEYASKMGRLDVVQFLLRVMGDWTQVSRDGAALEIAAQHGQLEVVLELLLAGGSNDDATWTDAVQRAIGNATRRRKDGCLLMLQLSLRDELYLLHKARTIHDANSPQATLPACLAQRVQPPPRPLPTVTVAAPAIEATQTPPLEGEGQSDKVEVAEVVVADLKHDLYVELSEMLMPIIEYDSDADEEEEEEEESEGWGDAFGSSDDDDEAFEVLL